MIGFAPVMTMLAEGRGNGAQSKFAIAACVINSRRRLNFKLMALLLHGEFLHSLHAIDNSFSQ